MLATNQTGGISWSGIKDAFGATAVSPGSRINMHFRFPGQYFDSERGEHYNLMRDYQPTTGRYLQIDPIGLAGGINQYGYAYAKPLSYIDPTGEVPPVAIAAAWAYSRCVASCAVIDVVMQVALEGEVCDPVVMDCATECLNPLNWFNGKKFGVTKTAGKKADDVIHVTKDGVALPPGAKHKIPDNYVQNPHRKGNYGDIVDGKYKERLRIDPATPPGKKGLNYSHYHKNGKDKHYSPKEGDPDPGF